MPGLRLALWFRLELPNGKRETWEKIAVGYTRDELEHEQGKHARAEPWRLRRLARLGNALEPRMIAVAGLFPDEWFALGVMALAAIAAVFFLVSLTESRPCSRQ